MLRGFGRGGAVLPLVAEAADRFAEADGEVDDDTQRLQIVKRLTRSQFYVGE